MQLDVRTYGDPVLREKAHRVEHVGDEIRHLADSMLETMYVQNGIGLAAEQVGRNEALCVVDVPAQVDVDQDGNRMNPDVPMPMVLINPEIAAASDDVDVSEEGCLSFPGIYVPVARPAVVTVRFLGRDGESCAVPLKGLVARAVQHEMDHLNGVLLVDRMSQVKKIALSGKLRKLKKETRERLQALA